MVAKRNVVGTAPAITDDPRWRALESRNAGADGTFYYAVVTTGIYCRPSCAARLPKPDNVRFYPSGEQAIQAGFRPCKRCKPDTMAPPSGNQQKVIDACRLIESADEMISLEDLAGYVGLSTYHFHRIFKAATGVTPRQYAEAIRQARIREQLESGESVTDAIYGSGYGSSSRFYERSDAVLGMTPSDYAHNGSAVTIHFAIGECSLGSILVAQSDRGICAIYLGDSPNDLLDQLQTRFRDAELIGGDASFEKTIAKVIGFIEQPRLGLDLPLDIQGTAFQQRVWQALREIPAGTTVSYAELAERIGSPNSHRAVANACGRNNLAVAVPCHRVVRSNGDLSGYRWGVARKESLIARESS